MSSTTIPNRAWAVFFARTILGFIFFMAGVYKVFQLGPIGHAQRFFLPFRDTFLPVWSLWFTGFSIPFVELAAGALLLVGWRTRPDRQGQLLWEVQGRGDNRQAYRFGDRCRPNDLDPVAGKRAGEPGGAQ